MNETDGNKIINLFEGIVSFRAVIESGECGNDRKIEKVYYSREKLEKNAHEFSYIKAKSYEREFEIELCGRDKLDKITTGSTHGGIAFSCSERTISGICKRDIPENGFFVMLEGIEDPYNFGYAVRSLYAAGVDGILIPKKNRMSAAGIVCRSSAGASERIKMFAYNDESTVEMLKSEGYRIVCSGIKNSIPVYDADLSRPLLLVVGGEKRGITSRILAVADETVRIEYGREFAEALSAASASAVLAFEVYRYGRKHQ